MQCIFVLCVDHSTALRYLAALYSTHMEPLLSHSDETTQPENRKKYHI